VVLRNQPIDVMDVRSILGMDSLRQETEAIGKILEEREADHCNWLKELNSCVEENREFRLAKDPHKCKFGQWYDRLLANEMGMARLTNNDLALIDLLTQFDQPHKRIHSVAERVIERMAAGDAAGAKKIVEDTRSTELASLRRVFAKCRDQLKIARSGLLFVLTVEGSVFGALVDRVSEVVSFSEDDFRSVGNSGFGGDFVAGVASWGGKGKMVLLLDIPAIARIRLAQTNAEMTCSL
jgi:purine-binding chemotaxis protein CheW